MINCRWIASDRPRQTPDGEPCPERHCSQCGRAHVTVEGRGDDQTCIDCIREIRDNLTGIVAMVPLMPVAAAEQGVDSEAAMLAGPSADPETWGYRRMSAIAGRTDGDWLADQGDEPHPDWVIGTWEMLIREHLEQPSDDPIVLAEAVAYIAGHLTAGGRLAHDPAFPIEELAREVERCHDRLEDVLAIREHVERGAPCPACVDADGERPAKRLEKVYGSEARDDRWVCVRDSAHWWDEKSYRLRVGSEYLEHAEALTADQIHETYRVSPATLRKWVQRGKVKRRGYDGQRRQLYDVAGVKACREDDDEAA